MSGAVPAAAAEFLGVISHDFARRHLIIGVAPEGGEQTRRLLTAPGCDEAAVFNTAVRLGRVLPVETADREAIARALDAAYGGDQTQEATHDLSLTNQEQAELEQLAGRADQDLLATSGKGAVVKLVDMVLFEALGQGASDVHVQPLSDRVLVRYRVDGMLHTQRELPAALGGAVVSRIKVMGRMDIAERRVPQDGRAGVTIGGDKNGKESRRAIDLRISTFPTPHGERAVIRLLESGGAKALTTLEAIGMPEDVRKIYLDRASRSNGIVLLTGPTGSGKTTTLYASLRWLAAAFRGELNIMTIEDPIEYELSIDGLAISQGQVNAKKGVTFATGLRHILRQDPDVVMVGEIRDGETARIAIQASLTGHLVFSTLHTNDAAGAVTRLVDLGVEPYLVSASLSAVLAQRLVRKVHAPCKGRGCEACFGSGRLGRTGLFELFAVDEELRGLIAHGATVAQLRSKAKEKGMRTLAAEGERLVREGITTEEEVLRVVQGVV